VSKRRGKLRRTPIRKPQGDLRRSGSQSFCAGSVQGGLHHLSICVEKIQYQPYETVLKEMLLGVKMSREYQQYTLALEEQLQSVYKVARKAREKGLDPALSPEPKLAPQA
jgi:hypothetical protein